MKLASGKEVSGLYGTMNQVHPRNVSDHYDSDYMSGVDAIKKTVLNHYSSTELAPGPYKGIVLRVLEPQPKEPPGPFSFLMFWEEDVELGPEYIIRVPELDSHIPEPENLEVDFSSSSKDAVLIQSHNIYTAASQRVGIEEIAEVGDIVWVDVKNGEYTYLGKIKNEATTSLPGGHGGTGGGVTGPDGEVTYPPGQNLGGTYNPPQYEGYLKNSNKVYDGFRGDGLSEYISKVRSRGFAPPGPSTTPKLKPIKHENWDLSPNPKNYTGGNSYIKTRLSSQNDKYPPRVPGKRKKGRYTKGAHSREDFAHILKEVRYIINQLGGGLYGGSWKTWISAATGRGPLLSMHSVGTATDMHANTTYQFKKPTYYEHNIEVQKNRHHWVQWLKMPKEASFDYAGRRWEAKKVSINAIRIPPQGTTYNWKTIEGIYFNLAECFEYFGVKGIGNIGGKAWWLRQKSKQDETWHLDARLTMGYVSNKTTVSDGMHSQSFRGYTTPAKKQTLPMYKLHSRKVWTGGAFSRKRNK